jgi:oxalate---CoA ligase
MSFPSLTALDAIEQLAATEPGRPALCAPHGEVLGYGALWREIEGLSGLLEKNGLGREQLVAVVLPLSATQVRAVAGVLHCCACAPLQSKTTVDEVTESLQRMQAAALIVAPEMQAEAEAAREMGLTVIYADARKPTWEWRVERAAGAAPKKCGSPEAILYLMTSATTGRSKVAPLTATNLNAGVEARRRSLQLTESDRMLTMTSMCHIIGVENAFAQWLAGGAVIATQGFDPANYLLWLSELRPTWYDCAPAVHQAALTQLKNGPATTESSLRFVQSAGAPLPAGVKQELEETLGVPVFNDYGMTEACPIAVDAFLEGGRVAGSAGRGCGLEIAILGDDGTQLAPTAEGEIAVRGEAVFPGYADNAEANAASFRNGWFLTGDVGHLDADGNLFVMGRLKEMINRGGEKVLPGEVDAALAAHPAVKDAAAFAVPHPTLGEGVACAVVLRDAVNEPVSALELRRFAAQKLASYKVPHRICFVEEIPHGELGKPQRWELAQRLGGQAGGELSAEAIARLRDAHGPVYVQLREMWMRTLNLDVLGLEQDFFDAGGDSLTAMNMLTEVDLRFGCETAVQAASFFDEPTLERLTALVGQKAARVEQSTSNALKSYPIRGSGAQLRLFCVPADGEEGIYFRRLALHLEGRIDLEIVRPENMQHSKALYTLENAGREMAALLRQEQPQGPYLLGGFCYGGIVAAEAARTLVEEQQQARLVLFDVPMPESPKLLADAGIWLERARMEWRMRRDGSHPDTVRNLRKFAARVAWSSLLPLRYALASVERAPLLAPFLRWAQAAFPLYTARPVPAPILHYMCTDEPHMIQNYSRLGWRKAAQGGIEERFVRAHHTNLFHESNLPTVVRTLEEWIEDQRQTDSQAPA